MQRSYYGKVIIKGKNKLELWKHYLEKLYRNANIQWNIQEDVNQENTGHPILKEEFKTELKDLIHNKATGIDNVSGNIFKALEGQGKETLFKIILYETYENARKFPKISRSA